MYENERRIQMQKKKLCLYFNNKLQPDKNAIKKITDLSQTTDYIYK